MPSDNGVDPSGRPDTPALRGKLTRIKLGASSLSAPFLMKCQHRTCGVLSHLRLFRRILFIDGRVSRSKHRQLLEV